MGRSILVAVLAAGAALLVSPGGTMAQQTSQTPRPFAPPLVGAEPPPENAPVYGATYIPGVGFRYLAPGSLRGYGYRAPVYGYYRAGYARARYYRDRCRADRHWAGDRCGRRWY